jgi:probable rRNA maturation factor
MSSIPLPITVATSGRGWATAWKARKAGAHEAILAAIAHGAARGAIEGEVEVEFASDAAVRRLNNDFRGQDKATNVLSFPNLRAPYGSIILALETVQREARAQGKEFVHHSKHLILHGFLHLLGYDHETATERRLMEGLEIRILGSMGIPNPYLLAQ